MLLPREHLPLSALDLDKPHGDFPASRLFESKIKILDLQGRLGSSFVLLARSETSRMVYALERESGGLYVLCKLGSWVDIGRLARDATFLCRERVSNGNPSKPADTSATPLVTPLMYKESKRRKLAVDEIQSLVRRRSSAAAEKDSQSQGRALTEEKPDSPGLNSQSVELVEEPAEASTGLLSPSSGGQDTAAPLPAPKDDLLAQSNAEDIFQNIRTQYFEALYHSKVGHVHRVLAYTNWLTAAGFIGVFCKRPSFQGQGSFPSGLRLEPRDG